MFNDAAIETSRLQLVLVSPEALELLRAHEYEEAALAQGFEFSAEFLATVNDAFLTRQLDGIRKRPEAPGWAVRAILRNDDDVIIGHCGFHGAPQDVGRAEIGYTIFEPYRRRGYAVEAVTGLVQWAKSQGSTVVFASVLVDNEASIGVVTKVGFHQTGIQGSEAVGEEYVFQLTL